MAVRLTWKTRFESAPVSKERKLAFASYWSSGRGLFLLCYSLQGIRRPRLVREIRSLSCSLLYPLTGMTGYCGNSYLQKRRSFGLDRCSFQKTGDCKDYHLYHLHLKLFVCPFPDSAGWGCVDSAVACHARTCCGPRLRVLSSRYPDYFCGLMSRFSILFLRCVKSRCRRLVKTNGHCAWQCSFYDDQR